MQQVALQQNSIQQISEAYNGLIGNIKLIDPSFNKPTVSRFRSKPEGIERVIALWAVFLFKYNTFTNFMQQQLETVPGVMPVQAPTPTVKKKKPVNTSPPPVETVGTNAAFRNQNGYTGEKINYFCNCNSKGTKHDQRLIRRDQVIELLQQGPITTSEIAKVLCITNRNVSTIFTTLRKRGHRIMVTKEGIGNYVAELV